MLETILLGLGGQLAGKLIANKFGPEFGDLATETIDKLGTAFGVEDPANNEDALTKAINATPTAKARESIQAIEAETADAILARVELQKAENAELALINQQHEADKKGPLWTWAWRPFWMWLLAVLWTWNIIVLHVLNAKFKTALPPADMSTLLSLTALYLGLYMGGHTIKDGIAKWVARTPSK